MASLIDIRNREQELLNAIGGESVYQSTLDKASGAYGYLQTPGANITDYYASTINELRNTEAILVKQLTLNMNGDIYSAMAGGDVYDALQPGNSITTCTLEPSNVMAKAYGVAEDKIDVETQKLFYKDPYSKMAGGQSYLNDGYPDSGMVFGVLGINGSDEFLSTANSVFGVINYYQATENFDTTRYALDPTLRESVSKARNFLGGGGSTTDLNTSSTSFDTGTQMTPSGYANVMGIAANSFVDEINTGISTFAPHMAGIPSMMLSGMIVSAFDVMSGNTKSATAVAQYTALQTMQTGMQMAANSVVSSITQPTTLNGLLTQSLVVGALVTETFEILTGMDNSFGFGGEYVGSYMGKDFYTDSKGFMGLGSAVDSISSMFSGTAYGLGLTDSFSKVGWNGIESLTKTFEDVDGVFTGDISTTTYDSGMGYGNVSVAANTPGGMAELGAAYSEAVEQGYGEWNYDAISNTLSFNTTYGDSGVGGLTASTSIGSYHGLDKGMYDSIMDLEFGIDAQMGYEGDSAFNGFASVGGAYSSSGFVSGHGVNAGVTGYDFGGVTVGFNGAGTFDTATGMSLDRSGEDGDNSEDGGDGGDCLAGSMILQGKRVDKYRAGDLILTSKGITKVIKLVEYNINTVYRLGPIIATANHFVNRIPLIDHDGVVKHGKEKKYNLVLENRADIIVGEYMVGSAVGISHRVFEDGYLTEEEYEKDLQISRNYEKDLNLAVGHIIMSEVLDKMYKKGIMRNTIVNLVREWVRLPHTLWKPVIGIKVYKAVGCLYRKYKQVVKAINKLT